MAPLVAESTSNSVGTKKKTLGRRKVEMKKIEALDHRHVTFSKRKKGLFQKADQLSSLTGTEIAVVVVSEYGRVFGFGTPSCDAVTNRYLAGLSSNQNANCISCQDDIGSMNVESIHSTSLNCSQNDNVHYQNNGAVVGSMIVETTPSTSNCSLNENNAAVIGSMIVETTPSTSNCSLNENNAAVIGSMIVETTASKGSPIRVLKNNILDVGKLELAPNGNADYQNDNAVVGSMIVETTPSRSNFPQSDGVVVGSKIVETTPLSSSCSEIRVLEDNIMGDGYLNLMNDTVFPAKPCEYREGTNGGSEVGEISGEMIEEMIEEMMKEKDDVPGCNEFMTDLVRVLIPTTTSNHYISLLVMEDEDELLMENRGLGTYHFNPYGDWRCGGICD